VDRVTLEAAATANFVTHATWASRRTLGARVDQSPELTVADSGLPSDTFNIVCAARLAADDVARVCRDVVERFREVGRPFSWWVAPGDEPTDLAERLEHAGLEAAESELAMAAEVGTGPLPAAPPIPGLTFERIGLPAELSVLAGMNADNWNPPDANVEEFYRRAARDLLGPGSPFRFHLARLEGLPVAAVEVALTGSVAGIYGLTTRAAWRGRGIASALLTTALHSAREEGVLQSVLQAAAGGVSLYRRLGFVEFGVIRELKPPPP